jgi:hypothetical protein
VILNSAYMGFPLSPSMILVSNVIVLRHTCVLVTAFDASGHGSPWLPTHLLSSLLQCLEAQVLRARGAGRTSSYMYYGIIHGLTAQLPVICMIAIDGASVVICVFDQ